MILAGIFIGLLCGMYYGYVQRSNPKSKNVYKYYTFKLNYKTFYSVWAVIALMIIVCCNISILYSAKIRVRNIF